MKLRLTLLSFCLFCIGLFSHAQVEKTTPAKAKFKAPLRAEKQYDKDGNLLPPPPLPPKITINHFKAPQEAPRDKDGNVLSPLLPPPAIAQEGNRPPPPPPKTVKDPPAPPPPVDRNNNPTKLKGPKVVKDASPAPKKIDPSAAPRPDEKG
jgi:hypothetical protein